MTKIAILSASLGSMLVIPLTFATSSLANPSYTPGTNLCNNQAQQAQTVSSNVTEALQNKINALPASKTVFNKSAQTSFTVPKNPFGYDILNGGTYSASANAVGTEAGLNTGTGTVTVTPTEGACTQTSTSYSNSGSLTVNISWPQITLTVDASVNGFLGQLYSGTPFVVTVNNLTANAPGTFTITGTSTNVTLSAANVSGCTVSDSGVTVKILGQNGSKAASLQSKIQQEIQGAGATVCSKINSYLSTVVGNSKPLPTSSSSTAN